MQTKGLALIASTKPKISQEHWEGPFQPDDGTNAAIAREVAAAVASRAASTAAALAAPSGVTTRHAAVYARDSYPS